MKWWFTCHSVMVFSFLKTHISPLHVEWVYGYVEDMLRICHQQWPWPGHVKMLVYKVQQRFGHARLNCQSFQQSLPNTQPWSQSFCREAGSKPALQAVEAAICGGVFLQMTPFMWFWVLVWCQLPELSDLCAKTSGFSILWRNSQRFNACCRQIFQLHWLPGRSQPHTRLPNMVWTTHLISVRVRIYVFFFSLFRTHAVKKTLFHGLHFGGRYSLYTQALLKAILHAFAVNAESCQFLLQSLLCLDIDSIDGAESFCHTASPPQSLPFYDGTCCGLWLNNMPLPQLWLPFGGIFWPWSIHTPFFLLFG